MNRWSWKGLAALVGSAALVLAAGFFAPAGADDGATVEVVNLTEETINFLALVPDGEGLKDDTANLLQTALVASSGALVRSVAPGAYRLAGTGFTSERVVLSAGDVVTLSVNGAGKGVQVAAKPGQAGATPAFAKVIGQQLSKQ